MAQTRLDFRVELNLQIRQVHKEVNRHGGPTNKRGKGRLSDQMKGKYCIFYEEKGEVVWETGLEKTRAREVDGPSGKRRKKIENKVVVGKKIKVEMCWRFAKRKGAFQVLYYTMTGFQQRPRSPRLQSGF